jgi:hypothetical protein
MLSGFFPYQAKSTNAISKETRLELESIESPNNLMVLMTNNFVAMFVAWRETTDTANLRDTSNFSKVN